ncbi:MBL fold metallo-hydrolase [Candidatus Woesebacteria bacterium]|nr:MBL fold metallo-hydrolase [Candidatus Woesebacteria bacterium]
MSEVKVKRLIVGSFSSNCYLVFDEKSKETLIVDPGDEAEFISRVILEEGLTPLKIIATHGHFDHLMAATELKLAFGIPLLANKKDSFLLSRMPETLLPLKIDLNIKGGDKIRLGMYVFEVLETPGHTPGSICLYSRENKVAFVGDLVFKGGGIGRYDFAYSDRRKLNQSIKKILKRFHKDTIIYSGHGEEFAVKEGKK